MNNEKSTTVINHANTSQDTVNRRREMRQQSETTRSLTAQKETEASLNKRRSMVATYISSLFLWHMFLIERNVKFNAQSARERTDKAQSKLMLEVKKVWGRYGRKIDRASTVGSVAIASPGR